MKKILVLFALSTVVFAVFAQDSKFIIGVEAAVIRTSRWGEDDSDAYNPLYSFSPGLNLEYLLTPKFSIKTSLLYERKGFTGETIYFTIGMPTTGTRDFTETLDYLTLPVLLSYSTKGTVRFYINGGAYFGLLLSNNTILGAHEEYPEKIIDTSDDTKNIDFGLSFGCGLAIPVGNHIALDFGLRDNLGLLDFSKLLHLGKARMNTIGIVASLKYRL